MLRSTCSTRVTEGLGRRMAGQGGWPQLKCRCSAGKEWMSGANASGWWMGTWKLAGELALERHSGVLLA